MKHHDIAERSLHLTVGVDSLYVKLLTHTSPEIGKHRPTLVFLHEALGSAAQWKSFPRELCQVTGCDGVVYDRVGHGQSSPMLKERDVWFYNDEAECVLPALLKELNIRNPILVGHSDGGTIALKYASSFPDDVAAVVSEAAHVIIEDITLQGIRDAQVLYREKDLRRKLARYHGDKTDTVFSAWADTWLQPGVEEWNMLEDLTAIRCPVLVIQGDGDTHGTRAQVDAIMENVAGPRSLLWIQGCGHVPHLEARRQVLHSIQEFIENLPGQRG